MATETINVGAELRKETLKIKIVGRRRVAVRVWIATRLFLLGGWIAGPTTSIEATWSAPIRTGSV